MGRCLSNKRELSSASALRVECAGIKARARGGVCSDRQGAASVLQEERSQAQKIGIIFFSAIDSNPQFTCTHKSEFSVHLTATVYTVREASTKAMQIILVTVFFLTL